ncbi:hypothetical protein [Microbacterium hominis]|uniref:Uncharacterized protein n=1 Tax=Microbacterium hominis TaxID=162426 RepID=A0A7D4U8F8_9MICO|nr:hypothetical protein [Microbacterium hominis]QKJ19966.1 hypothetical protein HQM25_11775 [Microbacterium hominis]
MAGHASGRPTTAAGSGIRATAQHPHPTTAAGSGIRATDRRSGCRELPRSWEPSQDSHAAGTRRARGGHAAGRARGASLTS